MYKIVNSDNFDGDYPDERFLVGINLSTGTITWTEETNKALKIVQEATAKGIADWINHAHPAFKGENAPRYAKVVNDDYQLRPGFES